MPPAGCTAWPAACAHSDICITSHYLSHLSRKEELLGVARNCKLYYAHFWNCVRKKAQHTHSANKQAGNFCNVCIEKTLTSHSRVVGLMGMYMCMYVGFKASLLSASLTLSRTESMALQNQLNEVEWDVLKRRVSQIAPVIKSNSNQFKLTRPSVLFY
jgi:hypothetical protein